MNTRYIISRKATSSKYNVAYIIKLHRDKGVCVGCPVFTHMTGEIYNLPKAIWVFVAVFM